MAATIKKKNIQATTISIIDKCEVLINNVKWDNIKAIVVLVEGLDIKYTI